MPLSSVQVPGSECFFRNSSIFLAEEDPVLGLGELGYGPDNCGAEADVVPGQLRQVLLPDLVSDSIVPAFSIMSCLGSKAQPQCPHGIIKIIIRGVFSGNFGSIFYNT